VSALIVAFLLSVSVPHEIGIDAKNELIGWNFSLGRIEFSPIIGARSVKLEDEFGRVLCRSLGQKIAVAANNNSSGVMGRLTTLLWDTHLPYFYVFWLHRHERWEVDGLLREHQEAERIGDPWFGRRCTNLISCNHNFCNALGAGTPRNHRDMGSDEPRDGPPNIVQAHIYPNVSAFFVEGQGASGGSGDVVINRNPSALLALCVKHLLMQSAALQDADYYQKESGHRQNGGEPGNWFANAYTQALGVSAFFFGCVSGLLS
jgi:hypothetical protein